MVARVHQAGHVHCRIGSSEIPARHPHTRRYPILSLVPRLASSGPQGLVIAGLHIHDGPPKRPGGVGQRWPRRAITSFQNLPEKQKRTALGGMRFWFSPAVVQGHAAFRGGFFFSWQPSLPQRRIEPSVWISRGLSMFLLPFPSRGRAVLTRATDGLL